MKDKSNLLKVFAIINIIITTIFGLYILIFDLQIFNSHHHGGTSLCVNKFNCSTCENGKTVCSYMNENGEQISGLQCPCDEENN